MQIKKLHPLEYILPSVAWYPTMACGVKLKKAPGAYHYCSWVETGLSLQYKTQLRKVCKGLTVLKLSPKSAMAIFNLSIKIQFSTFLISKLLGRMVQKCQNHQFFDRKCTNLVILVETEFQCYQIAGLPDLVKYWRFLAFSHKIRSVCTCCSLWCSLDNWQCWSWVQGTRRDKVLRLLLLLLLSLLLRRMYS